MLMRYCQLLLKVVVIHIDQFLSYCGLQVSALRH